MQRLKTGQSTKSKASVECSRLQKTSLSPPPEGTAEEGVESGNAGVRGWQGDLAGRYLLYKPGELSLIPRNHKKVGKNQVPQVVL